MTNRPLGFASSGLRLWLLLILASCPSPPTPITTETDGSYVRLPDDSTRAIVWGNHPDAANSLKTWLLKRRITVVDEAKVSQIAGERGMHQSLSDADVLKAAKVAGAKQVVFVEADILSQRFDIVRQLDITCPFTFVH